ncbi:MAG: hypothetical protein KAH22_07405 [Thiotrichaceae bacterium]|nr:hypothetical protein [Thiotrichaceae bacterium]
MNDNFNHKRKEFIEKIKPLLEKNFYNLESKSIFLEKWKEIVEASEFCKLKFSYKESEYKFEENDGEEYHHHFQFTQNYEYVDCTRETNPDCISGDLCFSFGQDTSGAQLAFIHTNSKNMVIFHEDNIYLSDSIDEEVFSEIKRSETSFLDFLNILKPEVIHTVLMLEDKYSSWLQIEKENLFVRYSCNITVDDEWDYGDKIFETVEQADSFYFSFIEKYANNNSLELSACSEDIKLKIKSLINKS